MSNLPHNSRFLSPESLLILYVGLGTQPIMLYIPNYMGASLQVGTLSSYDGAVREPADQKRVAATFRGSAIC